MAETGGGISSAAFLVVLLCLASNRNLLPAAEALWLDLPGSGTKCVSEDIQTNVVVLADYSVISDTAHEHLPTISVRVTSPYGNNLHSNESVSYGHFAFTTAEAGYYQACFWLDGKQQRPGATLGIDWKIGIAAKDWDSVAKKEKIEGVELVLRRLEGAVQDIHGNLIYLKDREARMREVSEKTNARVAWFSVMSLGICIAVSVVQLWYLKTYFQKKKLI